MKNIIIYIFILTGINLSIVAQPKTTLNENYCPFGLNLSSAEFGSNSPGMYDKAYGINSLD